LNPERIAIAQKFNNVWSRRDISGIPAGRISASFGNTYDFENGRKLGILTSGFFSGKFTNSKRGVQALPGRQVCGGRLPL
jgi:hypothetical protein